MKWTGYHWFGTVMLLLIGFAIGVRWPGALGVTVHSKLAPSGM
jgi:hypothetical protein